MELGRGFSGETGEAYKSEVREAVALNCRYFVSGPCKCPRRNHAQPGK